MAFLVGLQTGNSSPEQLEDRLTTLFLDRQQLPSYKVGANTYDWFRREQRPSVSTDDLGPYSSED